jgi:flagellar basal body P-ring formation protein FlgA
MKQAVNSLLILLAYPFMAIMRILSIPRENNGIHGRHITPFFDFRVCGFFKELLHPDISCSPRSNVHSRSGEGRIHSLPCMISRLLLFIGAVFMLSTVAFSSDTLSIRLKNESAIRSMTIYLGDVADLNGKNQSLVEILGKISLGRTPEFGSVRTLSRNQIDKYVQAETGETVVLNYSGAAAVQVRRKGSDIDEADVVTLLRSHIAETTGWNELEITVTSINNLQGLELPPGDSSVRISPSGTILGHRNLLAPLEILRNGTTFRSLWITADVEITSSILVATGKIVPGKVVAPDDVEVKTMTITDLRGAYARVPGDIVGKVARRNFSSGDPLTTEAFSEPFLINRGDMVSLRLERNGVILTSMVRAEQNGRMGQVIRVRNFEFSSVLDAEVTGHAEVSVQ